MSQCHVTHHIEAPEDRHAPTSASVLSSRLSPFQPSLVRTDFEVLIATEFITRHCTMDAENSAQSLVRHPSLWFEDGNIIIQAERTLFKVFKSVLSRESHFFKDMFSLPQPTTLSDIYESCPLLRVHESADDFSVLLRAVFDYT